MEAKTLQILNPVSHIKEQEKTIKEKLETIKKQYWSEKKSKLRERANTLLELAQIQDSIQSMAPNVFRYQRANQILKLERQAIQEQIFKFVEVKEEKNDLREEAILFTYKGNKISVPSGKTLTFASKREALMDCASIQLNQALYVIGGIWKKKQLQRSLLKFESNGKMIEMVPMHRARSKLSLSGNNNILLGVGGFDQTELSVCEKYQRHYNKWKLIPSLNKARSHPGSCVLLSERAFCFYGAQARRGVLKEIESLWLAAHNSWTILAINDATTYFADLCAAPFKGNIYVFGGNGSQNKIFHQFSEEGDFKEELTKKYQHPHIMCSGSVLVLKGQLYALNRSKNFFKYEI